MALLDDFNRANGAIGGNWLAGFGDSLPAINAFAAKGSAAGWYGAVWAPGGAVASFGPDMECEYTLTAADTTGSQPCGIVICGSNLTTGAYSGYLLRIKSDSTPEIGKTTAGSFATLTAGAGVTLAAGAKIKAQRVGTATGNLRLFYAPSGGSYPGTPNVTATDTAFSTGGVAASWNQSGANSNGMDDFGAETIGGEVWPPVDTPAAPPLRLTRSALRLG